MGHAQAVTYDVTSRETAIDEEVLSGDVGRLVTGQKDDSTRLFDRLTESTHGQMNQSTVKLFRRVEEIHEKGCLKRAAGEGDGWTRQQGVSEAWGRRARTYGHNELNLIPSLA